MSDDLRTCTCRVWVGHVPAICDHYERFPLGLRCGPSCTCCYNCEHDPECHGPKHVSSSTIRSTDPPAAPLTDEEREPPFRAKEKT